MGLGTPASLGQGAGSFHQWVLRYNKWRNNGCTMLNLVYETAYIIRAACIFKGPKLKVNNFYCYFLILVGLTFPLGILPTSLVMTKITVSIIEQLFFVNTRVGTSDKSSATCRTFNLSVTAQSIYPGPAQLSTPALWRAYLPPLEPATRWLFVRASGLFSHPFTWCASKTEFCWHRSPKCLPKHIQYC